MLSEDSLSQPKNYHSCPVAELRTLVTPSGVYVCPYKRGDKNFKIGDMRLEKLKSIWNGNERKTIMEKLDPSIHCKSHCIRHESNQFIINSNKIKKITSIREYDRFI